MIVSLTQAADRIRSGEPVAIPTETVYGLAASLFHPNAIQKTFQLKGRPADNPLIVHISNLHMLEHVAAPMPDPLARDVERLASQFWPGALTLVLPKAPGVPDAATAGLDTVAVRMPNHPLALQLISITGPLTAPSANRSGKPSPTCAHHVQDDFSDQVPVLDGGTCKIGLESTVLDLSQLPYTILRPGVIGATEIHHALYRDRSHAPSHASSHSPSPNPSRTHSRTHSHTHSHTPSQASPYASSHSPSHNPSHVSSIPSSSDSDFSLHGLMRPQPGPNSISASRESDQNDSLRKSPGTRYKHYSPLARVCWMESIKTDNPDITTGDSDTSKQSTASGTPNASGTPDASYAPKVASQSEAKTLYIYHQENQSGNVWPDSSGSYNPDSNLQICHYRGDYDRLASDLYDLFRRADREGFQTICIERFQEPVSNPVCLALINRIQHAMAPNPLEPSHPPKHGPEGSPGLESESHQPETPQYSKGDVEDIPKKT